MPQMIGQKLGSYEIIEEIGKGGMATVYRAYQPSIERDVAIKVIGRSIAGNEEAVIRFQREARLIARLEHIHILPVYDFDGTHEPPYIVMRYLEGGTLKDVMGKGQLPMDEIVYLLRQISGGLDYAHRQGIIHRDVKPSNIMIDPEGNSFVTDFGIARMAATFGEGADRLTQTGAAIGTPDYMSPEQGMGREEVDHRADIYSLGVMLFEMLSGELPFAGETPMEVIFRHARDPVPSILSVKESLPADADTVLQKALAKEPENRFESCADFSAAVTDALGGRSAHKPVTIQAAAQESQLMMIQKREQRAVEINKTMAEFREARGEISTGSEASTPAEHNQRVTAAYINAVEFAEIIEETDGVEAARSITSAFWDKAAQNIADSGGRIFNRGEGNVLALWGAEGASEDDPEMAVRSALGVQSELRAMCQPYFLEEEQEEPLPIKIGINTGLALLTPINGGSEYSASGATISLATRLSDMAHGTIVVSYETFRNVQGIFTIEEDIPIRVRGRRDSTNTYRIIGAKPRAFRVDVRGVQGVETAMVGRKAELELMQFAFQDAVEESETQVVTIISDAGLGKSRLLNEFIKWSELHPVTFRIFRGRATSNMTQRPYALLREMISFRFEILDSDSPEVVRKKMEEGVADLLGSDDPEMAHIIGHLVGFDFADSTYVQGKLGDPEQLTNRAKQLFKRFLVQICGQMPVVIQIEDIHMADDASLDLLIELASENQDLPLLLIALARPALLDRRPDWGAGLSYHTSIQLNPLTRRESRNLVGEILRKVPDVPKKLRDEIVNHAEGNPYFMEEVIKMLIEDRVIQKEGKTWLIEESKIENLSVPPSLAGLIQARIDTLLYPEKLLLQRASVVGRIFYDGAMVFLDKADSTHLEHIQPILSSLIEREFIYRRETSAFDGQTEYIFAQQMMRDVIYDSLLRRQLKIYHSETASWLEEAAGERLDEYLPLIADHYERGEKSGKAAEYLYDAAVKANLVSAIKDERAFLTHALEIVPGDAKELRIDILIQLGKLLYELGEIARAEELHNEGVELSKEISDSDRQVKALTQISYVYAVKGNLEESERIIDEALSLGTENSSERVAILLSLANVKWRQGDMEKARSIAMEVLATAREINDQLSVLRALNTIGIVSSHIKEFDKARIYFAELNSLAVAIGNHDAAGRGLNNLGEIYRAEGDLEEARKVYEESLAIWSEIGAIQGARISHINLGLIALKLRDREKARYHFQESLQPEEDEDVVGASLYDILGFAGVLALDGEFDLGAGWLGMIMNHPASDANIRADMDTPLEILQDHYSQEELEAALDKGKELDFGKVRAEMYKRFG